MINFIAPLLAISSSYSSIAPTHVALLTPKQVEEKLDTIIVFTPFSKGVPKYFSFEVDGKKKNIYFAAFSVKATNYLSEKIISTSKDSKDKYSYTPKSLSMFYSLIKSEKDKGIKADVVYIPDPDQKVISKILLKEQGEKINNIDNFIANNPIIFCPNPVINATDQNSKKSFIPCSTDYKNLKSMIDRVKFKKKFPWSKVNKPKVMAIPLAQFINTLNTSEQENIKNLRVIPSPSSIEAINQMNNQQK